MSNRVSVITVVYNDAAHIRQTIDSFFAQTWEEKEYIVIDGGSTDGTADIIREYADRLAYWCSEKDGGIYDAMNKGIAHAHGDWVNILNSGDYYCSDTALADALTSPAATDADVVFCNSIEIDRYQYRRMVAPADTSLLACRPTFRHGSSLIRLAVNRENLYDLSQSGRLGYALDWHLLYKLYRKGCKFRKADVFLEAYQKEGASNHPIRNLWYNYLITAEGRFAPGKLALFLRTAALVTFKETKAYALLRAVIADWLPNCVLPTIPFWSLRRAYLHRVGLKTGRGTFIHKKNYFINPNLVQVGEYSHINRDCVIDARGGITVGDSVSISHRVCLFTGSHDLNSREFLGRFSPIRIDDYAWLGVGCTVLQGVHIGRGAVVCAGAVVTRDVAPYQVVAGVPAKVIKERNHDLDYKCRGYAPLN